VRENVINVLPMLLVLLAHIQRKYTITYTLSNSLLPVSDEQACQLLDNGLISVVEIVIGGQRERRETKFMAGIRRRCRCWVFHQRSSALDDCCVRWKCRSDVGRKVLAPNRGCRV